MEIGEEHIWRPLVGVVLVAGCWWFHVIMNNDVIMWRGISGGGGMSYERIIFSDGIGWDLLLLLIDIKLRDIKVNV